MAEQRVIVIGDEPQAPPPSPPRRPGALPWLVVGLVAGLVAGVVLGSLGSDQSPAATVTTTTTIPTDAAARRDAALPPLQLWYSTVDARSSSSGLFRRDLSRPADEPWAEFPQGRFTTFDAGGEFAAHAELQSSEGTDAGPVVEVERLGGSRSVLDVRVRGGFVWDETTPGRGAWITRDIPRSSTLFALELGGERMVVAKLERSRIAQVLAAGPWGYAIGSVRPGNSGLTTVLLAPDGTQLREMPGTAVGTLAGGELVMNRPGSGNPDLESSAGFDLVTFRHFPLPWLDDGEFVTATWPAPDGSATVVAISRPSPDREAEGRRPVVKVLDAGQEVVAVVPLDRFDRRVVAAWSPDSEWVAVATQRVMLVEVATGATAIVDLGLGPDQVLIDLALAP